jgi:hypothetical protein
VQRRGIIGFGPGSISGIVAVSFRDDHRIAHFHNAALDALQLIAGSGKHEQYEEVGHSVNCSFALPHPYCFY